MGAVTLFLLLGQMAGSPATASPTDAASQGPAATETGENLVDPVARLRPYSREASARFGIPLAWVERVMRAESGGRTTLGGRPIVSKAGAMGLMQLMPATWAEMRARLALGADPYDPHDNIVAGTFYLRLMYDRFGYPGLFGAYNAGPARYAAWVSGRSRLPAETRAYLAAIAGAVPRAPAGDGLATEAAAAPAPATERAPPLFVVRRDPAEAASQGTPSEADTRPRPSLFVPLSPR